MACLVGGMAAGGGLAQHEDHPTQLLDVGEHAEGGGGGDVMTAVGHDELLVISAAQTREIRIVDRDRNQIPIRMTARDMFQVEQDRLRLFGHRDVSLPGVTMNDSPGPVESQLLKLFAEIVDTPGEPGSLLFRHV
ncbi:hypothetical protein SAMN06265360_11743 [Haloechinothrix alba]|uniref:Uncharacterized protein n=1 Tax=Haloechinothrix alba TaxID=664784 RepID=A0A238YUW6_9PSEU|nr:hypothetical protein SAMN06265360_11743 [Haloechinothrix alba]